MSARLLAERRFWPVFWTQFFGALNDNVFKTALQMLVTFHALSLAGLGPQQVVNLSLGLFIVPFFALSATAGQLADRYPKASVMRWVKLAEIAIMLVGAAGFLSGNLGLLLAALVGMGTHSTFFGPAKYSILPEQLAADELVGGNALVEMGTFVAILIGTIAGGLLIAVPETGALLVSGTTVGIAVLGAVTSFRIRGAPAADPALPVQLNPITPTRETFRLARARPTVFLGIVAISWFWFLGASFLTTLPSYTKEVLGGSELVVTVALAVFCVGIAVGSLLCERLSGRELELGLVPLGSIGMSLFAFDLFLVGRPYGAAGPAGLEGLGAILRHGWMWRLLFDLLAIAVFSGFYTVPLYTLIQERAPKQMRSRIVAANNILNSLFMVLASVMLLGMFALGAPMPAVFLVLALLNAGVGLYVFLRAPEFWRRFRAWSGLSRGDNAEPP